MNVSFQQFNLINLWLKFSVFTTLNIKGTLCEKVSNLCKLTFFLDKNSFENLRKRNFFISFLFFSFFLSFFFTDFIDISCMCVVSMQKLYSSSEIFITARTSRKKLWVTRVQSERIFEMMRKKKICELMWTYGHKKCSEFIYQFFFKFNNSFFSK